MGDRDEVALAFHFTNYQPLSVSDNLAKGAKLDHPSIDWLSPIAAEYLSRRPRNALNVAQWGERSSRKDMRGCLMDQVVKCRDPLDNPVPVGRDTL